MSEILELKRTIVYGPVRSRRLGRSLGINLMPPGRKVCTFDCLYCQYGWTAADTLGPGSGLPTPGEVVSAIAGALAALPEPPAFLTFSGNGEPTMHPDFPEVVERVIALRDRVAPSARTALLSNSSRVGVPAVRGALRRLDARIMKLDAGSQACFERFNRPSHVGIDEVVAGLAELGGVTLQALFAGGPAGNLAEEEVDAWVARVEAVRPTAVQVYTLARGYPSAEIEPAPPDRLAAIAERLRGRGIAATAF